MNDYDKNDHYDNIIKSMLNICHKRCFETDINTDCVTSCYHKYINTINKIEKLSLKYGKKIKSEFVYKIYKLNENLIEDLFIFPMGGKPILNPLRAFKYYDNIIVFKGENPFKPKEEIH